MMFMQVLIARRASQTSLRNYLYVRNQRRLKYAGMRLSLIFGIRLKRLMRCYRGIKTRNTHYIRDAVTLFASSTMPKYQA